MKKYVTALLAALTLGACSEPTPESIEATVGSQAEDFCRAYFNFDLDEAAQFMAPESRRWLSVVASAVQPADLEAINTSDNVQVEVQAVEYTDADSVRVAVVKILNALSIEKIGAVEHLDQMTVRVPLVLRDGEWLVRTEGPLRSEKQSRD